MRLRVIWVGKTREGYIKEAVDRYLRLIKPFSDIKIIETKDVKSSTSERSLQIDAKNILKVSSDFLLLHEKGNELTSVEFAHFINTKVQWDFVIGGPFGVHEDVFKKAAYVLSLSRMTFTHEMCRMILLEQIYRALTIIHKRGYHH